MTIPARINDPGGEAACWIRLGRGLRRDEEPARSGQPLHQRLVTVEFAGIEAQTLLATTLTLRAMMMTLKKKAITAWARATRRIWRPLICTSETWKVMPMTNAK